MVAEFAENYSNDLKIFYHGIYEYKKGVRKLILCTEKSVYKDKIEKRLTQEKIAFSIQNISGNLLNVFFGASECIELVSDFVAKKLNQLSAEEDFMLGTMLGYDLIEQCKRYKTIKTNS